MRGIEMATPHNSRNRVKTGETDKAFALMRSGCTKVWGGGKHRLPACDPAIGRSEQSAEGHEKQDWSATDQTGSGDSSSYEGEVEHLGDPPAAAGQLNQPGGKFWWRVFALCCTQSRPPVRISLTNVGSVRASLIKPNNAVGSTEFERHGGNLAWLDADDIKQRSFLGSMPPVPLADRKCPAAELVTNLHGRKALIRPELGALRMLKHAAVLTDLLHRPSRKILFVRARPGELAQAPPGPARRMRHYRRTTGPVPSITLDVPHIAAGDGLVVRISAGEEDGHHTSALPLLGHSLAAAIGHLRLLALGGDEGFRWVVNVVIPDVLSASSSVGNESLSNVGRHRLPALIQGDAALGNIEGDCKFGLCDAELGPQSFELVHGDIISRTYSFVNSRTNFPSISRAHTMSTMPAKPLTPDQQADVGRLAAAFESWKNREKAAGRPTSQEAAGALVGLKQSPFNQYLKGKIPLNPEMLIKFAEVFGVSPGDISPSITTARLNELKAWMKWADPKDLPHVPFGYLTAGESLLFSEVRKGLTAQEVENLTESVKLAIEAKSNGVSLGATHEPVKVYFGPERRIHAADVPAERREGPTWKVDSNRPKGPKHRHQEGTGEDQT